MRRARFAAPLAALMSIGGCGDARSGLREGAWELHLDSAGATGASWLRGTGAEGPRGEPQTRATILSFDCGPEHTGATILTDQSLRQGSTETELTLDAEPAVRLPGFAGTTPTGGQVVLTPPLDSVLGLLAGHGQATFDYEDGAGSSRTTAVFPLAGLDGFRERFLAACGPR